MSKFVDDEKKAAFAASGFVQLDHIVEGADLVQLRSVYDDLLNGTISTDGHRYDLGSSEEPVRSDTENITQVMWPSDRHTPLRVHPVRQRLLDAVRALYEDDSFDFDFDMMISKAPRTNTPTPAHQDQAYWIELSDKRAVSCWIALDESTLDNGCMWYGPGTHTQPLRSHRKAGPAANAPLTCDATEEEMIAMPLQPGSCGLHAGRTLHYSRGNTTDGIRRAYILNFRPRAMIEYERANNFDHGRTGNKSHAVRSTQ